MNGCPNAVTQPFVVDTSGSGEAAMANVRIVRTRQAHCVMPRLPHRVGHADAARGGVVARLVDAAPREQALQTPRSAPRTAARRRLHRRLDHRAAGKTTGNAVWNAQLQAKYNALDLGFSGDQTENVLWRLQHGEIDGIAPKVAVLMIGTNNTGDRQEDPSTTAAGIRRIVEELRQRLPDTKILLLAVFPRDEQPNEPPAAPERPRQRHHRGPCRRPAHLLPRTSTQSCLNAGRHAVARGHARPAAPQRKRLRHLGPAMEPMLAP